MTLRLAFAQIISLAICAVAAAGNEPPFFSEAPAKVEIRLSEEAVRSLRLNPREDVFAMIKAGDRTWPRVALHLKGSGTFQPIDEKPSLTRTFAGGKIHLNNSADDPSALNEVVGAYLAGRAGLQVRGVSHAAAVTLNGRRLGLYVLKEGFASPSAAIESKDALSWEELNQRVELDSF